MYVNIFQLTGASAGQNLFSSTLTFFQDRILTCRDRQYHDKFRRIFGPSFTNTAYPGAMLAAYLTAAEFNPLLASVSNGCK